jgi:hypothetical protein
MFLGIYSACLLAILFHVSLLLVFSSIKMFRRKNKANFNAFSCKSIRTLCSRSAFCLTRERGESLINKSINLYIMGDEIKIRVSPHAQTTGEWSRTEWGWNVIRRNPLRRAVKFNFALSGEDWKGKPNRASVFCQLKVAIIWQHSSIYLRGENAFWIVSKQKRDIKRNNSVSLTLIMVFLLWIWNSEDRASWYILIIKATRCTISQTPTLDTCVDTNVRYMRRHQR